MHDWIPALGMIGLAAVIGTTIVLGGPVGKALAEWIRGWSKHDAGWLALEAAKHGVRDPGDVERLHGEVAALAQRLAEVEERLDFTERLLARERQGARLAPPGAGR
jgi:hypothetical protein